MTFLKNLFHKLFSGSGSLSPSQDAYLSQATDVADLEHRLRHLERSTRTGSFILG